MARASLAGPLFVSAAMHSVALLLASGRLSWPAPPIPIEVVPRHQVAHRPSAPPPPAPPPTPSAVAKGAPAKPKKALAPALPPPPETTDLTPFAPDDATLCVLLRMDKLRRSPYRAGAELLLSALPDWSTLVDGSGVSPVDDFDALFIATADPHDVRATFLAARHPDTPKVRALTARRLGDGDPRVFLVVEPGLTTLGPPPADDKREARKRWLDKLRELDGVAGAADGPALLVTFADVPSLLRFGDALPTPLTLVMAATAAESPSLRLRAAFKDAAEAKRFARAWPEILARYRSLTFMFGLSRAFDDLKLSRQDETVELAGRIADADLQLALNLLRAALPQRAPPP